jgi:hypothetical protein
MHNSFPFPFTEALKNPLLTTPSAGSNKPYLKDQLQFLNRVSEQTVNEKA